MEFRSSDVMAYVLYKAKEDEHPLNKTQAQKVLYCCYGAVLAKFNERLTDEHPKAWPYGPLFPRAISDINKQRLTVGMAQEIEKQWSPELKELIDQTICTFSVYTATQLSNWSHFPGSPWSKPIRWRLLTTGRLVCTLRNTYQLLRNGEKNVQGADSGSSCGLLPLEGEAAGKVHQHYEAYVLFRARISFKSWKPTYWR